MLAYDEKKFSEGVRIWLQIQTPISLGVLRNLFMLFVECGKSTQFRSNRSFRVITLGGDVSPQSAFHA